jgi:hypothetical protein
VRVEAVDGDDKVAGLGLGQVTSLVGAGDALVAAPAGDRPRRVADAGLGAGDEGGGGRRPDRLLGAKTRDVAEDAVPALCPEIVSNISVTWVRPSPSTGRPDRMPVTRSESPSVAPIAAAPAGEQPDREVGTPAGTG